MTAYEYDFRNNRTAAIAPDGKRTEYTYDANGNVLTHTGTGGDITSYTYDSMNRNTSITDPYVNITTFEYNERSLLTKMTDVLGNEFEYIYDANGNCTESICPDGTSEKTEYDARVTKLTDRNGNSTQYTYDDADICIEMKSFEKFMIYVSTFHGKQKGCRLVESHFTIPGKILIRIVYKAGKIIGHFKNNVIESRFNSFRKIHYVYLLELESKYSSNYKHFVLHYLKHIKDN